MGGNIVVLHRCLRVHYTHIHPCGYGVIEKDGVHCLAYIVVATEREREVAHSAAYVRPAEILLYPRTGTYKVDAIGGVFFDACGHCKYVGVEDYILRFKAHPVHKDVERATANGYLAFVCGGLPLFVESHNNHGRT